jgi:hypothetical protein
MKLVKKKNSEGEDSEREESEGEGFQGEGSQGKGSQGEDSERETRILGKEKMGLYQVPVFDELQDHVDHCIANLCSTQLMRLFCFG